MSEGDRRGEMITESFKLGFLTNTKTEASIENLLNLLIKCPIMDRKEKRLRKKIRKS